jgi:hypothetical protein
MTTMFLTIEDGRLWLDNVEVTSLAHYLELVAGAPVVMASSSVDFPEEYTSDPAVLATVAAINALPIN